ncbi:virulence RhuM family protein [Thermodesulfobacteriota bacterium]
MPDNLPAKSTEFLLYQTEDGQTRIDVILVNETVWLSQAQMCELFDKDRRTISEHIRNIFKEGELREESVVRKFRTTAADGKNYNVSYYNLDVIISVGYRVKSHRGTQFRIWATQRLREYIIKGFTLDDERLKQAGGGNYFDELLERIRDIRSSEKVFWRKVLDIYATSIDYDPNTDMSKEFFSVVQNKMHWAAHGHTAAEIVSDRADANQPNMGMTTWMGTKPSKLDAEIAKNYLTHEELDILNRIVVIYLDFAELQARDRRPMYMRDWINKLDEFIRISERDILTHAGKISHEEAMEKAHMEYEKYRKQLLNEPSPVERHFMEVVGDVKKLEKIHKPRTTRKTRKRKK